MSQTQEVVEEFVEEFSFEYMEKWMRSGILWEGFNMASVLETRHAMHMAPVDNMSYMVN